MKKISFFSVFFPPSLPLSSVWFSEKCFIMCFFYFGAEKKKGNNTLFFCSFFKKQKNRQKMISLVLCTIVAWRVAFLFSSIDVGEHVCACVCACKWVCARVCISPHYRYHHWLKQILKERATSRNVLFPSNGGFCSNWVFFQNWKSNWRQVCWECENQTSVSLRWWFDELETQTQTGTELCSLTHQWKNFISKRGETCSCVLLSLTLNISFSWAKC